MADFFINTQQDLLIILVGSIKIVLNKRAFINTKKMMRYMRYPINVKC